MRFANCVADKKHRSVFDIVILGVKNRSSHEAYEYWLAAHVSPRGKCGAAAGVGNKLPTLHVPLFFLILLFVILIVVGDDIDCGFCHFEWDFDDLNAEVDGVADDETEASR